MAQHGAATIEHLRADLGPDAGPDFDACLRSLCVMESGFQLSVMFRIGSRTDHSVVGGAMRARTAFWHFSLIAGLTLVMQGCASSVPLDELRRRVAYEFDCSAEQLELTQLSEGSNRYGHGAQYGARGCGQRAVYVYSGTEGWINNTAGGEDRRRNRTE